ncbi:YqzE family protein [Fictibacillus sp. Mic-4]|uniref:YqzE family protein n=1 Tax=Fictibacillus TaxID=1329200 RepID=UPI00041C3E0A|nr:YqzE family protein [Fictibacillus gelatini]
MPSSNDYIKQATERFVRYIEEPKEIRKKRRTEKRKAKEPPLSFLFGLIPTALGYAFKRKKR